MVKSGINFGETFSANPKYTSAYAFDGSGKVKRSKKNYSLCVFPSGKQYNADLSASYKCDSFSLNLEIGGRLASVK